MILEQRIIYDGTDVSTTLNDFRSGTLTFPYETDQYVYIGSLLPFNNLWFELGTVNAVAATVSVSMWFGNAWVSAVDVIDGTSGLTQSGRLQWNTDILKGWDYEQRCSDVTGLSSFSIYNMFWLRLAWSANLTSSMTIKYVGQKFSTDSSLASFYPDLSLSSVKTAFGAGAAKTDWNDQHFMAAERIVADLKSRDIIKTRGQLLDHEMFLEASCHKVAEIVYTGMGKAYLEMRKSARDAYKDAMNMKFFNVDKNANGRADPLERRLSTGFLTR